MAAPHVSIVSTEWGAQLKAYRNALKLVIVEGPYLLDKMNKMIDSESNPDDYSHLEAQFGLQAGQGAVGWGELAAVVMALKADPDSEEAQAGNAAKLATKLKQFVDVVG